MRDFINDNACATADRDALLDTFAAELSCVAYHMALRQAAAGSWLDLELNLWQALANLVKEWGRKSSACHWLAAIKRKETPGTYPVGQALVFAALGLAEQNAFAAHQYGVAGMMLGAALRLMKINYLDTQAIMFEVSSAAESAYERVREAELEDMSAFAPLMDVLAAVHVRSTVRMFMN